MTELVPRESKLYVPSNLTIFAAIYSSINVSACLLIMTEGFLTEQ